jgi:hypothetical protein
LILESPSGGSGLITNKGRFTECKIVFGHSLVNARPESFFFSYLSRLVFVIAIVKGPLPWSSPSTNPCGSREPETSCQVAYIGLIKTRPHHGYFTFTAVQKSHTNSPPSSVRLKNSSVSSTSSRLSTMFSTTRYLSSAALPSAPPRSGRLLASE